MSSPLSRSIQIDQHGGAEQMHLVQIAVGEPGPGEVRIRHHAIGLNYIDVYQRSGLYPMNLPVQLGMEAAGVIVVPLQESQRFGRGRQWVTVL
jgi:NADPH2:quinone reductase